MPRCGHASCVWSYNLYAHDYKFFKNLKQVGFFIIVFIQDFFLNWFFKKKYEVITSSILKNNLSRFLQVGGPWVSPLEAKTFQDEIYEVFYSVRTLQGGVLVMALL